ENTPAVQMTMDSLSSLATDGTANLAIKAYNPAKAASQVRIAVNVADKVIKNETLDLPAGAEKTYNLNEKLPADVKQGPVTIRVTQGTEVLLNYKAYFKVGEYNDRIKPVAAPNPNEFPYVSMFNPVRNQLQIHGD